MTILANDIKLVASRVMDDVPEGGGAPTATVIVDGATNSIFPDISELDRAGGDVSLRKVFVHVQTDNKDTYLGSHVIVAEPPSDPNVSVTLFSTGETFDERDSATSRIESYLVSGPEFNAYLFENHVIGQRTIQLFQRPEGKLPDVGQTLILLYDEGLSTERVQYVRLVDVKKTIELFTDPESGKPFPAALVSCDISDPLRLNFPGSPPSPGFARAAFKSRIRQTTVGDAGVYAGVSTTTVLTEVGDISVDVESVFTQLVPSAQTEIPLADQAAASQSAALVAAANGTVTYTSSVPFNSETSLAVGNSILPGTLQITSAGGLLLEDTAGQLYDGATVVGTVDYARGLIAFPTLAAPYTGAKNIVFEPASAPLRVADTLHTAVTPETRAFNYVRTVVPPPAPGTTLVSFRSQGRWYDLQDDGGGVLRGADSSFGIGTVSYTTGTISVTLGALPDSGSAVLYAWGAKSDFLNRSDIDVDSPGVRIGLSSGDVEPGSVEITWNDGSPRTAIDDGEGLITGSAGGKVNYTTGVIDLVPTLLPAGGQEFSVTYDVIDANSVKQHLAVNPVRELDTTIEIDLGESNITPNSVRMSWPMETGLDFSFIESPPLMTARDDGLGNIVDATDRVAGTINYTTGIVNFQPNGTIIAAVDDYNWVGAAMFREAVTFEPVAAVMPSVATVTTDFRISGSAATQDPEIFVGSNIRLDITNRFAETIVPGGLNFSLGGRRYFDRLGALYNQLDILTGAATAAGTINYSTGEVAITNWAPGQSSTVDLTSLVTSVGSQTVSRAAFRVPLAPVRTGSFQLLATKWAGGLINVTADNDGSITGTGVRGSIDYEVGVVLVEFGALVTAAGNEGEDWYDVSNVVGSQVWKPDFVFADSVRFNAVAFSYLPLDADILGLDPVRLPQDGRVPIYRPGGFAVLGHTETSAPMTVAVSQTVDLDRVRLSRVRVIGANGATITSGYTADLEAGTLTFTNVTGYSQPVTIENRIEDLLQMSDVQISGTVAFTRPITHEFPVGSRLSSALIANNLNARVSHLFDQNSWDGTTWQDVIQGATAPATYNDTLAPVVVTNRGAVTERWALKFTSSSSFQVIGEHVGVIDVGTINANCSPINPATGTPYFTINAVGWGNGWSVGNIVRLNTVGAQFPVWVVRTVQQGAESVQDDTFTILVRGDVDRP